VLPESAVALVFSLRLTQYPLSLWIGEYFRGSLELQPISLRAIVRWRKSLQHGFEFFGISSQQRALIQDYCKDVTEC
jgi:hypothetical protein